MQKEIGSNFDLNPDISLDYLSSTLNIDFFGLKGSDYEFLSTGRGALKLVLDAISERNPDVNKVALIPSFTCQTVIEPFIKKSYKIVSYEIDSALNVNLYKFRESLIASEAQVVLVHRYFGFDTLKGFEKIIDEFSPRGIVFIEDRTQCLYSGFNSLPVDYIISSIRKWAGLPDGGFAVCKTGFFTNKPVIHNKKLEHLKLEASHAKNEYLYKNVGDKQHYLDLFRKAEKQIDSESAYYKISPVSVAIQQHLDLTELKKRRRENYSLLYNGLKTSDRLQILMPELTQDDVPLYFVMLLKERDELQNHLRSHDIYAPIVWPKADVCPDICNEAQIIYDNVLCLPIDQRYGADDIERIIKVIGRK